MYDRSAEVAGDTRYPDGGLMAYKAPMPDRPPPQFDHGPNTRAVAEYDRWVYRLANLPDGGTGYVVTRIGRDVFVWTWHDGVIGRARGRWLWVVDWRARRNLRAGLKDRKRGA